MSLIKNFIDNYSWNQNNRYLVFVNVMKEAQPFAFLSALSIPLSIFASRFSLPEASIYPAETGILFMLAFISILCFKFSKPNFGLFLDISYLCPFLGIILFIFTALILIKPENFGYATEMLGVILLCLIMVYLTYESYRTIKVDKLFKMNVIILYSSFFIVIIFRLLKEIILLFMKIDISEYQITGKLVLILVLIFVSSPYIPAI